MRILQIVPSISLVYGGPSQMVISLSQALAKLGEQVTIITTNTNGDAGQLPLDVALKVPTLQDGYEIIYFSCYPSSRYKFSLDLLQWLAIHAKEYDVAHIHALFSPVSTATATICRYQKLPYILRPLGTLDPADLKKKRFFKQIYGYLWEKPNLAKAAGIHFTSELESQISNRFGAQTKDVVIPLGVDVPPELPSMGKGREYLGIPKDIPLILFMSRLDPKKGLNLLIPALATLVSQGIDFHFVLAGSNPQDTAYEKSIYEKVHNSSLREYTTLTGFVGGELKWSLLQDADLFVLPSYYENFGIAVAEAMAVGVPVVISKGVYIWQEVVAAEAGWVCELEVASLTQVLINVIKTQESLKAVGQRASDLVKMQYSWSAIAPQTLAWYHRIVEDK